MKHIIQKWPMTADLARDAGVERNAAQEWKNRGYIPGQYDVAIVEGAERRNIEGVTYETLAQARAQAFVARAARRKVQNANHS